MSRSISYQRISCADFGNTKRVNKFIRRKPKVKDIKCGLKECKFNKGYCCCAKSIDVSTRTDCLTYSPDEKKRNSLFEAAADFTRQPVILDQLPADWGEPLRPEAV